MRWHVVTVTTKPERWQRSSGRVMQKVGMLLEGKARQATIKWGGYEDLILYGILHKEWASAVTTDS